MMGHLDMKMLLVRVTNLESAEPQKMNHGPDPIETQGGDASKDISNQNH